MNINRDETGGAGGPGPFDEGSESFFDLAPEDMEVHRTPSPPVAGRKHLDLKPALGVLCFLLVVGVITAVIILVWPSSRTRAPNLVGRTLSGAMQTARRTGFAPKVTVWEYSANVPDGVVVSQRPGGNKVVRKGIDIALRVSKGPRPETGAESGEPPAAVSAPPGQEDASGEPLSSRTVTVDPGHQALPAEQEWSDPGMSKRVLSDNEVRGVATGNAEYLVTQDTALKLKSLLEKDGIQVVMTRETGTIDLPDVSRADIAANAESDLYLRIHCGNSTDASRTGVSTLYPAKNRWTETFYENSKQAALLIQEQLVKSSGLEDLGVESAGDIPGFNWSRVPVVETQAGFLSNDNDDRLLAQEQFRWKVAWGLRNGIRKYLSNL